MRMRQCSAGVVRGDKIACDIRHASGSKSQVAVARGLCVTGPATKENITHVTTPMMHWTRVFLSMVLLYNTC